MRKPLTPKQRGFVKDYVLTGSGTEAAMRNYSVTTRGSAAVRAHERMKNPRVRAAIQRYADRIDDDLLYKRHVELLNKKEIIRHFSVELGEWIEEKTDQPETQAVTKGLDMAYKLKGAYAAEKSVQIRMNANIETNEKARELAMKFDAELKRTFNAD